QTGPIDPTASAAKPPRTSAPIPSASATCMRFTTWLALVKSATSASRAAIAWQGPSIDRYRGHARAARLQSRDQITIGYSILLHRDGFSVEPNLLRQIAEELAPGARLARHDGGFEAEFAHHPGRLRAAHHDRGFAQRHKQWRALVARFHHQEQRADSNAGKENHDVEFPGQQSPREIERRMIVFERHLAHRGRDHRDAAEALDQLRGFGGHTAFERDD